jgi:hypothetical protein
MDASLPGAIVTTVKGGTVRTRMMRHPRKVRLQLDIVHRRKFVIMIAGVGRPESFLGIGDQPLS